MSYVTDQSKLNAKNTVIVSLRKEINQIEYQIKVLEQSLISLVVSYFGNGISSTGGYAISELEQVKEKLKQISSDLALTDNLAEKLDVMTWVEDDEVG